MCAMFLFNEQICIIRDVQIMRRFVRYNSMRAASPKYLDEKQTGKAYRLEIMLFLNYITNSKSNLKQSSIFSNLTAPNPEILLRKCLKLPQSFL